MNILPLWSSPVPPSLPPQTLTEPAIFAKETSCDCRAPHERLTIKQACRGTPGRALPCSRASTASSSS